MSNWLQGRVIHITHWSDTLFHLTIDAPIAPFKPGQFTNLALTINDEFIQRAYSFVNPPNQSHCCFYITRPENGLLTSKLQHLNVGDTVQINQLANGFFTLDEVPTCKYLWMMATGTGISPYLSMLQTPELLTRFEKIILVFAVRYAKELAYFPLLPTLQRHFGDKLIIVPIVSRESTTHTLQGRIPALIDNHQLEERVGTPLTPEHSHVMLCGNPGMLEDTQLILKSRNMHKHLRRKPGHITSENYW